MMHWLQKKNKWSSKKIKIMIAVMALYVLAYGSLRVTHIVVHAGAFNQNGVMKYYDHRIEVAPSFSILYPIANESVKVVFFPAMYLEALFWRHVFPVSRV